jgi:hypothetical protein
MLCSTVSQKLPSSLLQIHLNSIILDVVQNKRAFAEFYTMNVVSFFNELHDYWPHNLGMTGNGLFYKAPLATTRQTSHWAP